MDTSWDELVSSSACVYQICGITSLKLLICAKAISGPELETTIMFHLKILSSIATSASNSSDDSVK